MIPRYSRPEMVSILSPENRLKIWLDVELQVLNAMAELDQVPPKMSNKVRQDINSKIDQIINLQAIESIEQIT